MSEMEEHYAGLSDQHLKNLAMGLIAHLEKEKMPESAQIIREMITRSDGRAKS